MANWPERLVNTAEFFAQFSKDRNTKVGAAIYDPTTKAVVSTGYNGFPRRVNDDIDSRHERPAKYLWTEHAERNAIYNAADLGISTRGKGIALGWFPCADCARAIIQSGITQMIATKPDLTPGGRWVEHHTVALEMLTEAGITIIYPEELARIAKEVANIAAA